MRTRFFAVPAISAAITCAAVFAVPAAASTGGTDGWGNALEVPGTAALNTGDQAQANAISCPSAGNCLAGGHYTAGRLTLPFVVSETHGTWQRAMKVTSSIASTYSSVDAVSCATAGNCTIALNTDKAPLVDSEVNGTWHKAEPIPSVGQNGGSVDALSCSAPGDCTAGGLYSGGTGSPIYLADEVNGVWGKAFQVPGVPNDIQGLDALSCASPGNCTASGFFKQFNSETNGVPFVIDEVHGVWRKAIQVPGTSAFPYGDAKTVSCATAGNCSAGGYYTQQNGNSQAFVANEVHGVWQKAIEVPGTGALNTGGGAEVDSISCPTAGNCTASGAYAAAAGGRSAEAFVASQVNGTWQQARTIPGIVALSKDNYADGFSISCPSPGNCAVGGVYLTSSAAPLGSFIADQVNGEWHTAFAAPGLATLSHGTGGKLEQVSCGAAGNCSAAGLYGNPFGHSQAFVISRP